MDINEILNWVRQRLRDEPEMHSHDERMISLGRQEAFNEVYSYLGKISDSLVPSPEEQVDDDWVSIDDVGQIADQM